MHRGQFHIRMQDCGKNESQKILDDKGDGKIDDRILNTFPKYLIFEHFCKIIKSHPLHDRTQAVPFYGGKIKRIKDRIIDDDNKE